MMVGADEGRQPSKNFGKYSLLAYWAGGGMADIYVARQAGAFGFDKLVALKLLKPEMTSSDHFREMFFAEARTGALLNHPNIVQTFDAGEFEGRIYLTMEFVNGESLSRLVRVLQRAGKVPIPVALAIVREVALALEYAHTLTDLGGNALRLVHRDVSPSNIMITHEGAVKLLDFGIAKVATESNLTKVGTIKGKFSYLAPEAVTGEKLDGRSDLFALGVVAWQLLSGERAYTGDNELAILNKILSEDLPAPSTINPALPAALDQLTLKALARDRNNRYQQAKDMATAIDAYLREHHPDFASGDELRALMKLHFGSRANSLKAIVAAAQERGPNAPMPSAAGWSMPSMSGANSYSSSRDSMAPSGSHPSFSTHDPAMRDGSGEYLLPRSRSGEIPLPRSRSGEYSYPGPHSGEHLPPPKANKSALVLVGVAVAVVIIALVAVVLLSAGTENGVRKFTVSSDPSGAQVLVDGKFLGETPVEVELAQGKAATLTLKKDGFKNVVRDIGAQDEVSLVNAVMESELRLGTLVISSTPSGAKVLVDDQPINGVTPLVVNDLPLDRTHSFSLSLQGYLPVVKSVKFDAQGKAEYAMVLESSQGLLEARCSPNPCDVVLNGVRIGSTPLLAHPLATGALATVQLRVADKTLREMSFLPAAGVTQRLEASTTETKSADATSKPSENKSDGKKPKTWSVASTPSAGVFVGGRQVCAATPCSVSLNEARVITLKAKGHKDEDVSLGAKSSVFVSLTKSANTTILD